MNVKEINTAILTGTFTNDELTSIVEAVKVSKGMLSNKNKRAFGVGSRVKFAVTRTGETLEGSVTKVAIKFVSVNTGRGIWKVPANMLIAA